MKDALKLLLSDFKFYRKRKGGVWYELAIPHHNAVTFWTDVNPSTRGLMILSIEIYD